MLGKDDNAFLTQVGPGTPMGEVFRRFWLPVMLPDVSQDIEAGHAWHFEIEEKEGGQRVLGTISIGRLAGEILDALG